MHSFAASSSACGKWLCLVAGVLALNGWERAAAEDADAVVIRSARSGSWSEPATWAGGQVPGTGARVLVQAGHRIVYDVDSEQVIRGVNIAGTLSFARDRDTRLDVGLIKIQDADEYTEEGFDCEFHLGQPDPNRPRPALEIGTPDDPLPAEHTALIRLVYQAGMNKDSCPSIVCCGGRMDVHGAPTRSMSGARPPTTAESPLSL